MAFTLALLSGFLHAGWNALSRHAGNERAATLAVLVIAWLVSVLAWVLWGAGWPSAGWWWVALAGGGEALYVFALGLAYAGGDLGLTYAVSRAVALICIWPLSWVAFETTPSGWALGATALVALGVLFARAHSGSSRWNVPSTLLTGASVALYHTGYKGAVAAHVEPLGAFVGALAIALPLVGVAVGREVRAAVPRLLVRPRLLLAGVLCAGSFLLMLVALRVSDSGRILGVRNSSVGFALLFAVAQGERLDPRQWFGLAVILAGVVAFAL